MKMILFITAALSVLAGAAGAAEIKDPMVFPARNGSVVYYHYNHVTEAQEECRRCHEGTPGKIEGFGKEIAHKVCFSCHSVPVTGSGASTCDECHTKK